MLLNTPDYLTQVQQMPGEFWLNTLKFMVIFNLYMVVYMVLNVLIMLIATWGMLAIFRLFGWTWLDGTTRGFINRS